LVRTYTRKKVGLGGRSGSFSVSTRISKRVFREIERIVWSEGYVNVGDYIRNLIRKDFKERGISVHGLEGEVEVGEESQEEEGEDQEGV